jgi:hypothetical protein
MRMNSVLLSAVRAQSAPISAAPGVSLNRFPRL